MINNDITDIFNKLPVIDGKIDIEMFFQDQGYRDRTCSIMGDHIDGLVTILHYLDERDLSDVYKNAHIAIKKDIYNFIEVMASLYIFDGEGKYFEYLDSGDLLTEMGPGLSKYVENGTFELRHVSALKYVIKNSPKNYHIEWTPLIEEIIKRLSEQQISFISELLETLWVLHELPEYTEPIDEKLLLVTIRPAYVLDHLNYSYLQGDFKAVSWCIFIEMTKNKKLEEIALINGENTGKSVDGYKRIYPLFNDFDEKKKIFEHFTNIFKEYGHLFFLYDASGNDGTHNLAKEVIEQIIDDCKARLQFYFPGKEVYDNFGKINKIYETEEEFCDFLKKVISSTNLLQYIIEEINVDEGNNSESLFAIKMILCTKLFLGKKFKLWLEGQLQTVTIEKWLEQIKRPGDLFQILCTVIEWNYQVGDNYIIALERASNEVIISQNIVTMFSNSIKQLLTKLSTQDKISKLVHKFIENAQEHLNSGPDRKIPKIFWDIFGEYISRPDLIKKKENIVHKLFIPLFEQGRRDEWGIKWLKGLFNKDKRLLSRYKPKEEVSEFKAQLVNAIQIQDACTADIIDIAKILGVIST